MPSNPSTGYRWRVENPAANVLRSLGPEVYSAPDAEELIGSAGRSTWRFAAKAAAEGRMIIVYQQPWAAQVLPIQTFDCQIKVRGG
ncbi:Chagasin family peptidase inhibitor I42 [compost metagenome]